MANGFRKVYVIVKDNHIFTPMNFESATIYRDKKDAERMCKLQQAKAIDEARLSWNQNQPIPQFKVHGYYLIHEVFF